MWDKGKGFTSKFYCREILRTVYEKLVEKTFINKIHLELNFRNNSYCYDTVLILGVLGNGKSFSQLMNLFVVVNFSGRMLFSTSSSIQLIICAVRESCDVNYWLLTQSNPHTHTNIITHTHTPKVISVINTSLLMKCSFVM